MDTKLAGPRSLELQKLVDYGAKQGESTENTGLGKPEFDSWSPFLGTTPDRHPHKT